MCVRVLWIDCPQSPGLLRASWLKMTLQTKCLCRGCSSWVVIHSHLWCLRFSAKMKCWVSFFMITGQSKELRDLLCNPHLRRLLHSIDGADSKREAMKDAMHEPLFMEFSDQCLKIVQNGKNNTQWWLESAWILNKTSLKSLSCRDIFNCSFFKKTTGL